MFGDMKQLSLKTINATSPYDVMMVNPNTYRFVTDYSVEIATDDSQIVLYQPDESISLQVKIEEDTVWLTQAQMVELFGSSKANISEHITNIYQQGELMQSATVRKFRTVRKEGNRMVTRNMDYYNLDMIINPLKSRIKTIFLIRATTSAERYCNEELFNRSHLQNLADRFDPELQLASCKLLTVNYKFSFPLAVPSRTTWRRPLMVRQP